MITQQLQSSFDWTIHTLSTSYPPTQPPPSPPSWTQSNGKSPQAPTEISRFLSPLLAGKLTRVMSLIRRRRSICLSCLCYFRQDNVKELNVAFELSGSLMYRNWSVNSVIIIIIAKISMFKYTLTLTSLQWFRYLTVVELSDKRAPLRIHSSWSRFLKTCRSHQAQNFLFPWLVQ